MSTRRSADLIDTAEARRMTGAGRKLWDRIKQELHAVQYTPGGKLFYQRDEVEVLIERYRKPMAFGPQKLMNPEIINWFN